MKFAIKLFTVYYLRAKDCWLHSFEMDHAVAAQYDTDKLVLNTL